MDDTKKLYFLYFIPIASKFYWTYFNRLKDIVNKNAMCYRKKEYA